MLVMASRLTSFSNQWSLEAESLEIIREAVANAHSPVMLYSIGKDSSVMLHLARKAFWPALPPVPRLHIDTTWKFREMIVVLSSASVKISSNRRLPDANDEAKFIG